MIKPKLHNNKRVRICKTEVKGEEAQICNISENLRSVKKKIYLPKNQHKKSSKRKYAKLRSC